MRDQQKLPRAELREGRLYVEGEDEPYVQGAIRHLWLDLFELKYHRHFDIDEGKVRDASRISGLAKIERDKLAIAGSDRPYLEEIPFSIRAMPEEESKYHWQMSIGFLPADWEIGSDDAWYCECYAPKSVFDEMLAAYRSGQVEKARVGCKTRLWIRELDWHAPPGVGVTWYLVPETDRQSDMPQHAVGTIDQLSWQVDAKPVTGQDKKIGPFEIGQAFAEETIWEATKEPERPPAPVKKDQNWKFALIVVGGSYRADSAL